MDNPTGAHRRRPRYRGTHPRAFHEKYKELDPERFRDDIEKVVARGDTPAGSHRPVMLAEVMQVLSPRPGEIAADVTLGYGGHAGEMLRALSPGGRLYGLDVDPLETAENHGAPACRGVFARGTAGALLQFRRAAAISQ